ncbi:MAG: hypothetical protein US76_04230 [Parcubacteria group bacterium GW2011_GWA2_38_13b]|nr:MAG: hypothetical protein US76_04230 [Parcubacteria group bacterium GW2011_GWA2_38_13b]
MSINSVIFNFLMKLGLTGKEANEAKTWFAVLELGEATVTDIARKTGLPRTTVYNVVEYLVERKLVTARKKKRGKYYSTGDPVNLLYVAERNVQLLKRALPWLRSIHRAVYKAKTQREFYKDKKGIRAILDSSPDCVKILDTNGRLVYLNKGGMEEHGFKTEKEAIGWDWLSSIIEEQREYVLKLLGKCLQGKSVTINIRHVKSLSTRDQCSLSLSPMRDEEGKIINILAISRERD